jgi:hypothetical protein
MDKTVIRKGKIKEQGNDFLFWQSQPYETRLALLEQIRQEYNDLKYGPEQRFQRVYRIVNILKIRFFCFQINLIFVHKTLVERVTGENQPYYLIN